MRNFFIVGLFFIVINCFAGSNNTLWSIANKVSSEGEFSVQQVMLAILHTNRNSFSANNVNSFDPDSAIVMPSKKVINLISKQQAYLEVEKQNVEWNNHGEAKIKKPIGIKKNKTHKIHKILKSQAVERAIPVASILTSDQETAVIKKITDNIGDEFNTKIENIEKNTELKITETQSQVGVLINKIDNIEKNVEQLNQLKNFDIRNLLKPINKYSEIDFCVSCLMLVIFLLLMFLLICFVKCCRKSSAIKVENELLENKEEFVASKINLARAYIDMGKEEDAKNILNEVLAIGNQQEHKEAEELLEKIKNK